MIELLVVVTVLGGGGIFLATELKTGFSKSKAIGAKINMMLHGPPSPEKLAEVMLLKLGSRADGVREAAANIEAHRIQSKRIALEESEIARDARAVAEEALQAGDKRTAEQSIIIAINSEEKARFLQEKSEELVGVVADMKIKVKDSDADLEDAKILVDRIRWHAQFAEANKNVYELTSDVSAASGGFSAQGSLKQLAEKAERDAIASAVKLEFARQGRSGKAALRKVLKDSRVEHELEAMRQRVALPAGNKDAQADVTIEVLPPEDSDEKRGEPPTLEVGEPRPAKLGGKQETDEE